MKARPVAKVATIFICIISVYYFLVVFAEYRAASLSTVAEQTSVVLPNGTNVIAAKIEIFSLTEFGNYDWLLYSDSSLLPWAESIGKLEGPGIGGWAHIRTFQEVSPFVVSRFSHLGLNSVWRINPDKSEETLYLYIASDKRSAVLSTFRP